MSQIIGQVAAKVFLFCRRLFCFLLRVMSLPADYHMHTPLCHHATGEPTEYAEHAIKVGLTEIGFSEHNPMIRDDYDDWHMYRDKLDEYVEKVNKARRDHPNLTSSWPWKSIICPVTKIGFAN